MGILSFGKSKNQGKVLLKEQPACYWEEESYMAVVPGSGMPDVSADAVGRVESIAGVTLLESRLPEGDKPGLLRVEYGGEVYEAGFYAGAFSLPEMMSRQGYYFTDDEMDAVRGASSALTLFMKFGSDAKMSYHLQVKLAVAMVPDAVALMDESAERLVCGRWAVLAAQSAVVPGASALFTVQAVGGDGGGDVWLHTHGLNRCGLYELEILASDNQNYNDHYHIIATLASRMLDCGAQAPAPGEGMHIGMLSDQRPIVATYVSWVKAMGEYDGGVLGGARDRIDSHNGRTAPVFLYTCEDDEKQGRLRKVSVYDGLWGDNPMFFLSKEETERMSALARERFGLVTYMAKKDCRIILKVGLKTDSAVQGDEREHIWFELIEAEGDRFRARLMQEPYDVASMHEGDEGTYGIDDVTDWHIMLDGFAVTPDTAYLLV